jgi:hypothetical protein
MPEILRSATLSIEQGSHLPIGPPIVSIGRGKHREQRVLITLDKDFGELAIRRSLPHCGIVRLVNISARQQGAVCQQVLTNMGMNWRGEPLSRSRPAACAFAPR